MILTVTPASGKYIRKSDIVAEKLVDPGQANAPGRRLAPAVAANLSVSGPSYVTASSAQKQFSFVVPADYAGAAVTVTFRDVAGLVFIDGDTQSNDINNSEGTYILTADVNASIFSYFQDHEFKGELIGAFEGELHTINMQGYNYALFNTINGGTVKNVMLDNVSVSDYSTINGKNATGAIAHVATGSARIYNCGILATSSTVTTDEDGYTEVTSSGSTVGNSSSDYVGGLVGFLDGEARVVNCFSYADITAGKTVGGIVGYNNVATTANSNNASTYLKTMVMNCMFYGNISDGVTNKAPIYNGQLISNKDANGVSNFNYFWGGASYVQSRAIDTYNCALMAETRYLQRFEFFRNMLNSNRELAAWWATGNRDNKDEMLKWILEPSQIGTTTPYPILKVSGKYASVVNIDAENAEDFSSNEEIKKTQYNQGRRFGTLAIRIQMGSGDGSSAPDGAVIVKSAVTRNITDKDPKHFNFNYYKVQLPYYNEVGTKNYTDNKVVTGWKIVSMSKSAGSFSTGSDAEATVSADGDITLTSTPYNFADRNNTAKDIYSSTNKRVFSQGAYFDVPEGVTSITIEPYWGKCVYVSDQYPDVVYNTAMSTAYNATNVSGERYTNGSSYNINGSGQNVYTTMANAVTALNPSGTVYDNAIVLVGNVHSISVSSTASGKPYTIMSIDLDEDNEPDYSYILRYNSRVRLHPVRVDFINIIGLGMAQKSNGGTGTYNFGILQPLGWFESTNTSLFRFTQFEYDKKDRVESPMILQGGVIEQWVTVGGSETTIKEGKTVTYYHVGGNVWFKEFHIGVHQDKTQDEFVSPHPPISVTGGDFNEFYLTGLYNTPNANTDDNAECYINGGRFKKVAGTGMQGIGGFTMSGTTKTSYSNGNIIWQIDNADINEFYAGGINAAHIAEGNIYTVIFNSRVDQFCGGPKFGNMNTNKKVVTNATDCTFRAFFGAGYGGNSYNRRYPNNQNNVQNIDWNSWVSGQYKNQYNSTYKGVDTRIDYQFIPMSGNASNVARLFVDYVSFSLATTHDVTSKLTGCTITKSELGSLDLFDGCIGNFYGGGSLGKVDGPVKSTLKNCTVEGNVYGAGYSATTPTVAVMNNSFQNEPYYDSNLGVYLDATLPTTVPYKWEHKDVVNSTATAINTSEHKLYTTEDLTTLGTVTGKVTLNVEEGTTVGGTTTESGNVYGGGESSDVYGVDANNVVTSEVEVNIKGGEMVDVYGGGEGKNTIVGGDVVVNIGAKATNGNLSGNATISGNVYGGSALGAVNASSSKDTEGNVTTYSPLDGKTTAVNIYGCTSINNVFGGGLGNVDANDPTKNIAAQTFGDVTVTMEGGTVSTAVYGGSNENGVLKGNSTVTLKGGTVGTAWNSVPSSDDMPRKVFGGGKGQPTLVEGDVEVNIGTTGQTEDGVTVWGDVYGGSALGNVNAQKSGDNYVNPGTESDPKKTEVNLHYGNVKGSLYGGGLGLQASGNDAAVAANVYGPVTVTVDGGSATNVFGCNNYYGSPQKNVAVNIAGGQVSNNVYGGGNLADALGTITVEVSDGSVGNDVYGGGSLAQTNTDTNTTVTEGTQTYPVTNVLLTGGAVTGNVYGGGLGRKAEGNNAAVAANVNGPVTVTVTGGKATDVFGCNNLNGAPQGTVTVNVTGTAAGTEQVPYAISNVFGGGNQADYTYDAGPTVSVSGESYVENVFGGGNEATVNASSVTISTDNTNSKINQVFGGGNEAGVTTNATVSVTSGKVLSAVYGGCNEQGTVAGDASVTLTGGTVGSSSANGDEGVFGGGLGSATYVTGNVMVNVGTSSTDAGVTVNGNVYGGSAEGKVNASAGQSGPSATAGKKTRVNLFKGLVNGDVYGGGLGTSTNPAFGGGDVQVLLNAKEVYDDTKQDYVTTTVTPTENGGCKVKGNVFGCNNLYGSPTGAVTVHVYGTLHSDKTKINEKYNPPYCSTDQGDTESDKAYLQRLVTAAKVSGVTLVNSTTLTNAETTLSGMSDNAEFSTAQEAVVQALIQAFDDSYDVKAVYGGGNQADYIPTSGEASTTVIIEGCNYTSIKNVYGGGNAAAVPATKVQIKETHSIDYVFGGGNGKDKKRVNGQEQDNTGANVGYKTFASYPPADSDKQSYGTGKAEVELYGGSAHFVYGGSNSRGNVRVETSVKKPSTNECPLVVKEIYGAGKNADMDGATMVSVDCFDGSEYIYGGAMDANVAGGVTLIITGGTYKKVFGGNNLRGTIQGPIKLFLEEGSCGALNIEELYLGGNQAAYSVYGYYSDNGTLKPRVSTDTETAKPHVGVTAVPYANPELNIVSCTKIGKVFGGGLGATATMYGSPIVNIHQTLGDKANAINNELGQIGAKYNNNTQEGGIYGGGWEAAVYGNPTINICTPNAAYITNGEIALQSKANTKMKVLGANIVGNVYGGGLSADVFGNTQVNIGTASYSTNDDYKGVKVTGSVFGGGEGSTTLVSGNVNVNIGSAGVGDAVITGDVYGGSAMGKVNTADGTTSNTYTYKDTQNQDQTGYYATQVNLLHGTIIGNAYGGGYGQGSGSTHDADVFGDVTVTVNGIAMKVTKNGDDFVTGQVFGANNVKGSPKRTVTVNVNGITAYTPAANETYNYNTYNLGAVYGGGNQAAFSGTSTAVNMTDGKVEYVFGGGLGDGATVNSGTSVTMSGGTANYVYGGGSLATVTGNAKVSLQGNAVIDHDVFGGGNLAPVNGSTEVKVED